MSDRVIAPSTGGVEIEDNNLPPPVIEAHLCANEEMSEVSVPSRAVPIATAVPEDATNIVLPATPPLRSFRNMNEDMFEEGYDSDGEIGPFFDQVMIEDALVSAEEEIPGEESALVPHKRYWGTKMLLSP